MYSRIMNRAKHKENITRRSLEEKVEKMEEKLIRKNRLIAELTENYVKLIHTSGET